MKPNRKTKPTIIQDSAGHRKFIIWFSTGHSHYISTSYLSRSLSSSNDYAMTWCRLSWHCNPTLTCIQRRASKRKTLCDPVRGRVHHQHSGHGFTSHRKTALQKRVDLICTSWTEQLLTVRNKEEKHPQMAECDTKSQMTLWSKENCFQTSGFITDSKTLSPADHQLNTLRCYQPQ